MSEQNESQQDNARKDTSSPDGRPSPEAAGKQDGAPTGEKPKSGMSGHGATIAMLCALIVIVGIGIYYFAFERNQVETTDAYVNGNMVRLTPQVAGTVIAINTDNTQFVRRGQVLVQLDPNDNDVGLEQAKASLGQTVRDVAQLFTQEARDAAAVAAAQTQLTQATQDLDRDRPVFEVHGVSAETLVHDENAVHNARALFNQAEANLASTRAQIVGASPEDHPRVLQAEANVRTAWLAAARTKVVAPVSGYVVSRAVQLGQQVSATTEMLAIVPIDSVWIDANFKENQLRDIRIGQPVEVKADIYGGHVRYHGKVLGLNAGTGSALAVLPAQNASGNWIKIVQRLPVRVGLDPTELAEHPLFLGLSTSVHVDTHDRNGTSLSEKPVWPAASNTPAYQYQMSGAEDEIRAIVSKNLGRNAATSTSSQVVGRLQ
jgi:membrane fusion protein (multidrug efflux system)